MKPSKVYSIVRGSLSEAQKAVQSAHALMELSIAHGQKFRDENLWDESIVLLEARSDEEFERLLGKAGFYADFFASFREPYWQNLLTAFAFLGTEKTLSFSKNMRLMGSRTKSEKNQSFPSSREELIQRMEKTEQTNGVSILRHGEMVADEYRKLKAALEAPERSELIPSWLWEGRGELLPRLQADEAVMEYLLLHDCGKPLCEVEIDGGKHFPDHAIVSARAYLEALGGEADPVVHDLILHDMKIHLVSAAELDFWSKTSNVATHLLAGMAEVRANASMFGGSSSQSFKIKMKHLERRGKALIKLWKSAKK